MKLSSVSPERCETICAQPACRQISHRLERLGDGSDLVDLDERRRCRPCRAIASAMIAGFVHEEVVADELHLALQAWSVRRSQPSQSDSASPSSMTPHRKVAR